MGGALFSIVMIWLLTGILVFMAVQRVIHRDFDIDADAMIITAGCGVAFNIIMFGVLHADCAPEMGKLMKHLRQAMMVTVANGTMLTF